MLTSALNYYNNANSFLMLLSAFVAEKRAAEAKAEGNFSCTIATPPSYNFKTAADVITSHMRKHCSSNAPLFEVRMRKGLNQKSGWTNWILYRILKYSIFCFIDAV